MRLTAEYTGVTAAQVYLIGEHERMFFKHERTFKKHTLMSDRHEHMFKAQVRMSGCHALVFEEQVRMSGEHLLMTGERMCLSERQELSPKLRKPARSKGVKHLLKHPYFVRASAKGENKYCNFL